MGRITLGNLTSPIGVACRGRPRGETDKQGNHLTSTIGKPRPYLVGLQDHTGARLAASPYPAASTVSRQVHGQRRITGYHAPSLDWVHHGGRSGVRSGRKPSDMTARSPARGPSLGQTWGTTFRNLSWSPREAPGTREEDGDQLRVPIATTTLGLFY